MELYRKVKASERLPDNQGKYLTGIGWCTYFPILNEWRQKAPELDEGYRVMGINYWLELYEEKREEGKMEADEWFDNHFDCYTVVENKGGMVINERAITKYTFLQFAESHSSEQGPMSWEDLTDQEDYINEE